MRVINKVDAQAKGFVIGPPGGGASISCTSKRLLKTKTADAAHIHAAGRQCQLCLPVTVVVNNNQAIQRGEVSHTQTRAAQEAREDMRKKNS